MKPELRLRVVRRVTVSPRRPGARLHELVPTVVLHLVAAGVNAAALTGLNAPLTPLFAAGLAACTLGSPVIGLALSLAFGLRAGAPLLVVAYTGSAMLGVYGLLGMGALPAALSGPPSVWKLIYFATAALLPMLQVKGIFEITKLLLEEHSA